jgi:hypothetical protein
MPNPAVWKSRDLLRVAAAASAACALVVLLVLAAALTPVAPVSAQEGSGDATLPPAAPADLPNAIPPALAALRINELMASNNTAFADPDEPDQFPDWVEIYNPGTVAVNLANVVAFTDSLLGNAAKSPITQTLIIPAQGFLVLILDEDTEQGPEHLNFRLSGDGEEFGMFYVGGATPEKIDSHEFGPQTPDVSIGRKPDGTGDFVSFTVSTPGQSNVLNPPTVSNVTASFFRPTPETASPLPGNPVTVTAVITDNGSVTAELVYSTSVVSGEQSLPMAAGAANRFTAQLPGQANGTYVRFRVVATDDEGNSRTSSPQGYVVGYQPPLLRINEVVAANQSGVEDVDDPGDFPDWLELYNPGTAPVSLLGLSFTDNPRDPEQYVVRANVVVPARGFVLVYLDDDPSQSNATNIHTNFRLNEDGDFIGLYGGRGTVLIDGFDFGPQGENAGIGRFPDGDIVLRPMPCTSPKAPNINCVPQSYLPSVFGAREAPVQ